MMMKTTNMTKKTTTMKKRQTTIGARRSGTETGTIVMRMMKSRKTTTMKRRIDEIEIADGTGET